MKHASNKGQLYIDGKMVGEVLVHGWNGAWGLGDFEPAPAFAPFAGQFDEWSRLMHDPASARKLTRPTSDRLRQIERQMYARHAKIYLTDLDQWRDIAILNIDARLIEWKETWSADSRCDARPQERR